MATERIQSIENIISDVEFIVNPTKGVLRELTLDSDVFTGDCIDVLLREETFNSIDRELSTASKLAELIDNDVFKFKKAENDIQDNIVVIDNQIGVFVDLNNDGFLLMTDVDDEIDGAINAYKSEWVEREELSLRTPIEGDIKEQIVNREGEGFYEDFSAAVLTMEETKQDHDWHEKYSDRWHIYASLVIAGGFNKSLLKEVGLLADEVGLGSRATISRVKTQLAEHGYIDTQKGDNDLGRPPERLVQAGLYQTKDIREMASMAYDTIKIKELDPERDVDGDNESEEVSVEE